MRDLKFNKSFLPLLIILAVLVINLVPMFRMTAGNPSNAFGDYYSYSSLGEGRMDLIHIIFSEYLLNAVL